MLSAAEGAAKMKHHTENKVPIETVEGDVEESNGEEHVLEEGSERLSQLGWQETNILAWACATMLDGGS